MLEPIEVMGKRLEVKLVRAPIRNSYARVRGDYLVIRLPERMSERSAMKAAQELHGRMAKALQKDPARFLGMPDISFQDKDTITVLGDRLPINILCANANSRRIKTIEFNGSLYVTAPPSAGKGRVNKRIRSFLEGKYLPVLQRAVSGLNERHFGSKIGRVSLRDNLTMWGSCSRDNNIALNFRLLYAPPQALEYVIVHELAHTKIRNHSKGFWELVASIIPDYRERRGWLKRNSHRLRPTFNAQ